MGYFNFFISGTVLLMLFLWGAGIFVVFRIAKKYIPVLSGKKIKSETLAFYFAVSEAIVWGGYLVLAATVLMKKSLMVGLAFLLFVLALGIVLIYVYFRDYISGLIIKMEKNLVEGDYVYGNGFEGRIRKLNVRNVEVETDDSEIMGIPYYRFLNGIVKIRKHERDNLQSFSFLVEVNRGDLVDFQAFKERVAKFLISLPWVKSSPLPDVVKDEENDEIVRITVYPLMIKFSHKIEKAVNEKFGNNEETK